MLVQELHQGFVKGVRWDPVGEYLTTQSDDIPSKYGGPPIGDLKRLLTNRITISWSPDGAHITSSNVVHNTGTVFVAASLRDIRNSLVRHKNTVEVAAWNPYIFLKNSEALKTRAMATRNICFVVSLGADDRSVSVQQTKSALPLIVASNVFERQILDLSWAFDGLTLLYACSSDRSTAVFYFEVDELEGMAPASIEQMYFQKFGFKPLPIPTRFLQAPPPSQHQDQHHQHITSVSEAQGGFGTPAPSTHRKTRRQETHNKAHVSRVTHHPYECLEACRCSSCEPEPRRRDPLPAADAVCHPRDVFACVPAFWVCVTAPGAAPQSVGMAGKGRRKTGETYVDAPRGRARTLGGNRVRDGNRTGVVVAGVEGAGLGGLGGANVRAGGTRGCTF
ncbi:hypothetical protein BU17DRAFT_71253 [Hysterangium stoloniferum]|nr:hypothetical protein BU17DRAFT_71253 [Hysterangium stoloniferum]